MNIPLDSIVLDASIQCRAQIDTGVVNEYADAMTEGATFPPVELFGAADRCWPGDGWHRIMAAKQIGYAEIPANLHAGGRIDALKHALAANAIHGHRRTTKDKRRCIEIALNEFGNLSDVQIARLCAVTDKTVSAVRDSISEIPRCETRTTSDGRQYPANPARRETTTTKHVVEEFTPDSEPVADISGMEEVAERADTIEGDTRIEALNCAAHDLEGFQQTYLEFENGDLRGVFTAIDAFIMAMKAAGIYV